MKYNFIYIITTITFHLVAYIHVLGNCRKDKEYLHSKSEGLGHQKWAYILCSI